MLMKWMDLEPGDKIKISERVRKFWYDFGSHSWVNDWCYDILIINEIHLFEDQITLNVSRSNEKYNVRFTIWKDTGIQATNSICPHPLFEVVELKED